AYERLFQNFYPEGFDGWQRLEWATEQLKMSIRASRRLGTANVSVLSGGFAWPYFYPWPQPPEGLYDEAFRELGRRWSPVLLEARENGVTIGFELHPGGDLHDGVTFERFLDVVECHESAAITYDPSHMLLQNMDYLEFIHIYHDKIACFHVKDAEFVKNGKSGVYGGFQPWAGRPGRFRSLGDGQVDFKSIFSLLTQYDYGGWAVLEWECCLKSAEQGAAEGAGFIRRHIIRAAEGSFDDFAKSGVTKDEYPEILGYGKMKANQKR
ncbi:MAG: sugar phosphate isomerase/epimerase, partial [Defluviitaleaceae bacterium]|nr:sugar phosphate isomerase/epimerase [Defluviitaleaceae bacterium]